MSTFKRVLFSAKVQNGCSHHLCPLCIGFKEYQYNKKIKSKIPQKPFQSNLENQNFLASGTATLEIRLHTVFDLKALNKD